MASCDYLPSLSDGTRLLLWIRFFSLSWLQLCSFHQSNASVSFLSIIHSLQERGGVRAKTNSLCAGVNFNVTHFSFYCQCVSLRFLTVLMLQFICQHQDSWLSTSYHGSSYAPWSEGGCLSSALLRAQIAFRHFI